MPFPCNEDVVDRRDFAELYQLLPASQYCQSAAVYGPGWDAPPRAGPARAKVHRKTQIALEYAYRRGDDRSCSIFWVHADSETTFTQGYKSTAKKLGLPSILDGAELLAAVRSRTEADPCWLLVLSALC